MYLNDHDSLILRGILKNVIEENLLTCNNKENLTIEAREILTKLREFENKKIIKKMGIL